MSHRSPPPFQTVDHNSPWFQTYHKKLRQEFKTAANKRIAVLCPHCSDAKHLLDHYRSGRVRGKNFLVISLKELERFPTADNSVDGDALQKSLDQILDRDISQNSPRTRRKLLLLLIALILLMFSASFLKPVFTFLGFPETFLNIVGDLFFWIMGFTILVVVFYAAHIFHLIPSVTVKHGLFEGKLPSSAALFGSNAFLEEVSRDLAYIARKHHCTVVFEDFAELNPVIRDELLTRLGTFNQKVNQIYCRRFRLRRLRGWFFGKDPSCPPIRFVYLLTATPKQGTVDCRIDVVSTYNSHNSSAYLQKKLSHVIAIDCDELNRVCRIITSEITDTHTLNEIVEYFEQRKPLIEQNTHVPVLAKDHCAKLLAMAAYHQLDPAGYDRFVNGPAGSEAPISSIPPLAPQRAELLMKLRQGGYLDPEILRYLSCNEQHSDPDFDLLLNGTSTEKQNVLKTHLYKKQKGCDKGDLHDQILSGECLQRERDPEIVLLLAEYLDTPPQYYLKCLMVCLQHRKDFFYNFSHPRCYFHGIKLQSANSHRLIPTSQLHGEHYFKNILLALSRFPDEELREALLSINSQKLVHHLCLWMDLYYFNFFYPIRPTERKLWNAEWDACMRVLLLCLENSEEPISGRLLRKRFGGKTLRNYMNPCNSPKSR